QSSNGVGPARPAAAARSRAATTKPKLGPINGPRPMATARLSPSATAEPRGETTQYHLSGEPNILGKHVRKQAAYSDVKGKLISHGIKVTDWDQKRIGDCWLVSGVSAVAQKNPKLVEDAIRSN